MKLKCSIVIFLLLSLSQFAYANDDFKKRNNETQNQYRSRIVRVLAENLDLENTTSQPLEQDYAQLITNQPRAMIAAEAIHEYANVKNQFPAQVTQVMAKAAFRELFLDVYQIKYPERILPMDAFLFFDSKVSDYLVRMYSYEVLSDLESQEILEIYRRSQKLGVKSNIFTFIEYKTSASPAFRRILLEMLMEGHGEEGLELQLSAARKLAELPMIPHDELIELMEKIEFSPTMSLNGIILRSSAFEYLEEKSPLSKEDLKLIKRTKRKILKRGRMSDISIIPQFNKLILLNTANGVSRVCQKILNPVKQVLHVITSRSF